MFNLFNSFLGSETPRTNNPPPSLLTERTVEVNVVEEDKLLSDIKLQISIAKKNIQKDIKNPSKEDTKILKILKETLNETFTNSYYIEIVDSYDSDEIGQTRAINDYNSSAEKMALKFKTMVKFKDFNKL